MVAALNYAQAQLQHASNFFLYVWISVEMLRDCCNCAILGRATLAFQTKTVALVD